MRSHQTSSARSLAGVALGVLVCMAGLQTAASAATPTHRPAVVRAVVAVTAPTAAMRPTVRTVREVPVPSGAGVLRSVARPARPSATWTSLRVRLVARG